MLKMIGEIRGIQHRTVNKDNKQYDFYSLVVEDENMDSHQVSLGRDQDHQTFRDSLEKLKGKVCEISVYIRSYTSSSGKNFALNYSGDALPREVKAADLAKVS
jgi:hypothetical protein